MASRSRQGPPGWNLDWASHYSFYIKPRMFAAKKLMMSCRKSIATPGSHQENLSPELKERNKRILAITHPGTGIVILEGSEEKSTDQIEKTRELSTIIHPKIDEVILEKDKYLQEVVTKVKERKKAISIINPNTGKDIFDDGQISTEESKGIACLQPTPEEKVAAVEVSATINLPVSRASVDSNESASTFLSNSHRILQYSRESLLEIKTEVLSTIQPSHLSNSDLLLEKAAVEVPATINLPVSCASVDSNESASTFLSNSHRILQYSRESLLEIKTEVLSTIQPSHLLNSDLLLEKTTCQICFKDFTSKISLESHIKNGGKTHRYKDLQSNTNWREYDRNILQNRNKLQWRKTQLQSHPLSVTEPCNIPNLDILKKKNISPVSVSTIPLNYPVSASHCPSFPETPITIVDSEISNSVSSLPAIILLDSSSQNETCSNHGNEPSVASPTVRIQMKRIVAESKPKIGLKDAYNEKQRSPLKLEGKRQYNRDFLLQLQSQPLALIKPKNLPNLDIIKNKHCIPKLPKIILSSVPTQVFNQSAQGGVPKMDISPVSIPTIPLNHSVTTGHHPSFPETSNKVIDSTIDNSVSTLPADILLDSLSQNERSSNYQIKTSDASPTVKIKVKKNIDQWSPLNPEGKRRYNKDFLLQLQSQPLSLTKPMNLPNLDIIKNKPHIQKLPKIIQSSVPVQVYNQFAHKGVSRMKSYSSFLDVTSTFSFKRHMQKRKNSRSWLSISQQSNFEKVRQFYKDFLLLLLNHPLSPTELHNLLKLDFIKKKALTEVSAAIVSSNHCVPVDHHESQSIFLSNLCRALQYSRDNLLKIQTKILSTTPPSYLLNSDLFLKKTRCPVCFVDFTSKISWKRHMKRRKKTHSNQNLNQLSDSQRKQYYKDFLHFLNHPSSFNGSSNLPNSDIIKKEDVAEVPAMIAPSTSCVPSDNSQLSSEMLSNPQLNSESNKFDKYDMMKYDRKQYMKQKVSSTASDSPTVSLNKPTSLKRRKQRKRRCKAVSNGPRYLYYYCSFMKLKPPNEREY